MNNINNINGTLKIKSNITIFLIVLLLILSPKVMADSYSNQASHSTLYTDTLTSKTDGSPVRVADSDGFQVTTGNVGIGTTTPNTNLHVYANPNGRSAIRAEATTENAYLMLDRPGDNALIVNKNDGTLRINHFGSSSVAHLVILTNGNVGLGTATPFAAYPRSGLHIHSANNSGTHLRLTNGNGPQWSILATGADNGAGEGHLTIETTGSLNIMTLLNNGYVGIGTASPTAKIHIGGTAGVDGIKFPDGTLQTTAASGGGSSQWAVSGSNIYYSSGNVGIGTAAPNAKLVIGDDLGSGEVSGNGIVVGDAAYAQLVLGKDHNNRAIHTWYGLNNYYSIGTITGGTNKFDTLVLNNGNVGIGTTTPGYKLDVLDNSNDMQIKARADLEGPFNGAGKASIGIDNIDSGNNGGPSGLRLMRGGATKWAFVNDVNGVASDDLTLWQQGSHERMTVKSSGNVGIGTSNPDSHLHVSATDSVSLAHFETTGTDGRLHIRITGPDGIGGLHVPIGSPSTPNGFHLVGLTGNFVGHLPTASSANGDVYLATRGASSSLLFGINSNEKMRISNSGNIGIGTANPGSKATIANGDVYVSTQGNGIILKDTSDGTCRRVILNGGSLSVSGIIACPAT